VLCTVKRASLLALAGVVLAIPSFEGNAQNAQGTIVGHVSDPSGAVVPGAQVTIRDLSTGVTHTYVTSASGDYTATDLNPGNYSITVAAKGFSQEATPSVTLEVAESVRQDFKLPVGTTSSTIQVTANTQMLQTEDESVGQVMSGKLIEALPVNGRDFTNLMITNIGTNLMQSGSGMDYGYHGLNTEYYEVSADGAEAQSASYSIDGIYDADFFFSVPINIPNELAIQEFRMLNGMYGAQYGQGSAQVNVAVKSGTNRLHGGAYESLQANWLEPDNEKQAAENALSGTDTPLSTPYHQNQFGGYLGGPLWKNKVFWFGSYDEGLKNQLQAGSTAFVPTADEIGGNFSSYPFPIYNPATTTANPNYIPGSTNPATSSPIVRQAFTNNQIPAALLDPISSKLAAYYAAPNITSCSEAEHALNGCSNYAANTSISKKQGVGTARLDQYLGDNDHLFETVNIGTLSQTSGSIAYGQGGEVYARPKLYGMTWSHTFNADLLNQATLGYTRDHYLTGTTTAYGPNLSALVGLANTAPNPVTFDLPNLNFSEGYQSIGGGEPTTYTDNIYQLVDTVTLLRGKHEMNFGIDFRRVQLYEIDNYLGTGSMTFNGEFTALNPSLAGTGTSTQSTGGTYSYTANAPYEGNAFADFLLGDTSGATGPPPLGTDNYNLWGNNINLFFQDDIKATPRLTLNAGLRWERPTSLHSNDNSGYAFSTANGGQYVWADCGFVQPILQAGGNPNYLQCGASNTLVPIDNKDFAPRLGFAYRPEGFSEKLVVRSGFGIFYDTYNRYYDGTQYDRDSLYNQTAAVYTPPTGDETESTAVVRNLWAPPTTADQSFSQPSYLLPFNQVNWPGNHNPYNEQWNLDTQYALQASLLLDIGYVGGHGVHQPAYNIIGAATPPKVAGDPCNSLADASLATGSNASCATDPNFQPIDTRTPYKNMPPYLYANENGYNTNYNALQMQLIGRATHGLTFHLNYTYSKTMDITSAINLVNGEPDLIQDNEHPGRMYGLAASNEKHRVVATYAYEVPNHIFHAAWLRTLAGGWTTSGIYQLAGGFPFGISGSEPADQEGLSYGSRFLANSTYHRTPGFKPTLSRYFDTSEYSNPELGTYGNTNKSPEVGPYFTNLDMSVGKTTQTFDEQSLVLRLDIFNAQSTWHSNPTSYCCNTSISSSSFGSIIDPTLGNASLFTPYTMQLTAQYSF
jgi:hypothetical protein